MLGRVAGGAVVYAKGCKGGSSAPAAVPAFFVAAIRVFGGHSTPMGVGGAGSEAGAVLGARIVGRPRLGGGVVVCGAGIGNGSGIAGCARRGEPPGPVPASW